MIKNYCPSAQMASRKKNQTSQKRRIQEQKKHQIQEGMTFFTNEKKVQKRESYCGISIGVKGKRIESSIKNRQVSHKLISQMKVQGFKRVSNSSNYKNPHTLVLNDILKKSHINNHSKPIQKFHINIGISTQRGNCQLYQHLVAVIRRGQNNNEFCHMNEQILTERRQAQLNSKFHQRVNRLTDITIENKKIYHRINSQKSHYLKDEMTKSYESNMEISRRLSMSRLSQKSGRSQKSSLNGKSRCSIISNYSSKSMASKKSNKIGILKAKNHQKQPLMRIESNNVKELKSHQLQHFVSLFDHKKPNNSRISSRMSARNIKSTNSKENRYQISEVSKTLELKNMPRNKENQKLPKLSRNHPIISICQQSEENFNKISDIKKKVLSAINENIPCRKQPTNKIEFLHKIIEQPIKGQKMAFPFETFKNEMRRL